MYMDQGVSKGMMAGRAHAESLGIPIEERWLGDYWNKLPIYKTRWE